MSNDLHENSDWRLNCKNNVERWKVAREKKIFTDVEFKVGEGNSAKIFAAHKNVLALSSPVFEAMFFGLMPEENLVINNTSPEAFNNLLSCLYGEQISFDSVEVAAMTYFLADQYIMEDLRSSSQRYLTETNLTESQFWELYLNEDFLLIPDIEKKCQDYIENNACVLLKSPQLGNITPKRMEEIVAMEKLNITEFELLSSLIEWGSKNVHSLSELRHKLSSLLCYIQFSNLTLDEFCSVRKRNRSFMDSDDAEMIMAHIHDKKAYRLPHWCTDSTERRKPFMNDSASKFGTTVKISQIGMSSGCKIVKRSKSFYYDSKSLKVLKKSLVLNSKSLQFDKNPYI